MNALHWLAAAMTGTPARPDGLDAAQLLELAAQHDVEALLADAARNWADLSILSGAAREELARRRREALAVEAVRTAALEELTSAFDRARVPVLLVKGAALAYTHYPSPFLRPRSDTDLLIARDVRAAAERVLAELGYVRDAEPDADVASAQRHYVRTLASGVVDAIDLHWRVVNPQAFAGPLDDVPALMARSVAIPALAGARTVAPMDALLIACVHRVAHHQDRVHLIWLWDIHLLVSAASRMELETFAARAGQCAMSAVCVRSLTLARSLFGTPVPDDLLALLAISDRTEASSRFVGGGMRLVDIASADFLAAAGWKQRLQLAREHLFPAPAYMRRIYPRCPGAMLPLAYVHRIVRGAPKWLRRPES